VLLVLQALVGGCMPKRRPWLYAVCSPQYLEQPSNSSNATSCVHSQQ
jgi:hypothetical protein